METVKADVLRDICDGRYENLGRLGTIVPFTPLQQGGKQAVVARQLEAVAERVATFQSKIVEVLVANLLRTSKLEVLPDGACIAAPIECA